MRPPQDSFILILVIGELVNRYESAPVTFSSENLDIRHRLPDHSGQGCFLRSPPDRSYQGLLRPRAVRSDSKVRFANIQMNRKVIIIAVSITRIVTE